jgi:mannose-1-phosphate guanylyltransferase
VQPRNRGTAAGILLPLLEVLRRDPDATVAVVPSDHFVRDEATLARSLERAFEHVAAEPGAVVLLGITPDAPESDYGWIVPAPELAPARRVERFVEKPSPEEARRLLDRGGAWNSFLFVASARILLEQFQRHLPELTSRLGLAFANGTLDEAYEDLEPADFSRDVLQASAEVLRLESVPACGWTDLGTPRRLGECLAWLGREGRRAPARAGSAAALDLAIGLERVGALAGAAV